MSDKTLKRIAECWMIMCYCMFCVAIFSGILLMVSLFVMGAIIEKWYTYPFFWAILGIAAFYHMTEWAYRYTKRF